MSKNWIVYSKPAQDERGWHYTRENEDGTVDKFYCASEAEADAAWFAAFTDHAMAEIYKPRKSKR